MKRSKRPNPISARRLEEGKIYRKKVKAFLAKNPFCEYFRRAHDWKVKATEVHHTRGRAGRLFLAEEFWAAVSKRGHERIHNRPTRARDLGLLGPWGKQD